MEENRFLRCVAEYRSACTANVNRVEEDRFRKFVKEERGILSKEDTRPWDLTKEPESPTLPPSIFTSLSPTTQPNIIYYSPRTTNTMPETRARGESIEERYARTVATQRALSHPQAYPQLPTSPLVVPRRRQDSTLSIMSEESFPSLPSGPKSTPTTPQLTGWSDALRKNLEDNTGTGKRSRLPSRPLDAQEEWDEEEMEEYIEHDEDGFPHLRYRQRQRQH
jgi:hypothetical protein